ncbi:MAG TPA: glycerophosphodiester phosphodiesterase family protein, partial [Thiolinea sp.]|nr:glycerophosphodiester phosphodiesterase family protein [Thiolinea sp.]
KAVTVNPGHDMLDRRFVEDAHARGLLVCAYTVNEVDELARMAALAVDGVFCNYPERVLNAFDQPDTRHGWRGLAGTDPQPDGRGLMLRYP